MPIYEYDCPRCETKFELMRPFSQSNEPAKCPDCQTESKRALSKFACFTTGEPGVTAPMGGGGCAGCSAGSCTTCGG